MELTLVGLQNSGKTTLVNVIAVHKIVPTQRAFEITPRLTSFLCE